MLYLKGISLDEDEKLKLKLIITPHDVVIRESILREDRLKLKRPRGILDLDLTDCENLSQSPL